MNFPKSLLTLLSFLAFTFGASPATAKHTPEEIDQKIAAFIEKAPEQYVEQRVLMEEEVAPFLDALDSLQLRRICQSIDPDAKLWYRIVRHAARRIGQLDREAGLNFFQKNPQEKLKSIIDPALAGWAEVDPKAAVDWILEHHGEGQTLRSLVSNLREQRKNLEAVLALPGLENTEVRKQGMTTLGRDIIRRDAQEAYEWFLELPANDQALVASEFLLDLSSILPEKAARLLPNLPTIGSHWGIIGNWALTDPEAAFGWTKGLSNEKLKHDGRCITLAIWTDIDPLTAWTALLNLPTKEVKLLLKTRSLYYGNFLQTSGAGGVHHNDSSIFSGNGSFTYSDIFLYSGPTPQHEDHPKIASRIGLHYRLVSPSMSGEELQNVMMSRLSISLLPEIITRAHASPHRELREFLENQLALRQAKLDLTNVDDFITTFGDEEKASAAIRDFALRSPKKALPLAMKLEKSHASAINQLVANWVQYEPEEARLHVESLPAGELRTLALEACHRHLKSFRIRNNLAETKAAFEELPLGSSERRYAFDRYLILLLEREEVPVEQIYQEIDAHLKTQKSDPPYRYLGHDIIPALVKRNPEALARWAKTLPESRLRYEALRAFWERWETYGPGEGVFRLKKLGIEEKEIRSSRY